MFYWICPIGDDDEEEGEEGEEAEEKMPTCGDYIMHFLTLFWKVLFAIIPPAGNEPIIWSFSKFRVEISNQYDRECLPLLYKEPYIGLSGYFSLPKHLRAINI